jgi:hypothetical protein
MSAPFSCISVAIVWRDKSQAPVLPSFGGIDAFFYRRGHVVAVERLALRREEHG